MQTSPVTAVPPGGWFTAAAAVGLGGSGSGGDHNTARGFCDIVDLHILEMRKEQIDTAAFLAHTGMQHNDLAAAR